MLKIDKRLWVGLVLALAGTMLWANLSWAQCRGGGGPGGVCPVNPTSQNTVQGQGRGQGNANCPYYPGYGKGAQGRGAKAQGSQGQQGAGRNTPNPPANQPNAGQ
ncbi:MAG: hypothetical protein AB1424_15735 [Thermodesulfobacteriota bacterium]